MADDVLALWDQFAEDVANAGLMGSLRVPKHFTALTSST
jgi:hypothetical protein